MMRSASVSTVVLGLLLAVPASAQIVPEAGSMPSPNASLSPTEAATAAALFAQQQQIAQLQNMMYGMLAYQALAMSADGGQLGFDASAYFTNGASLLTVPSGDQPGASWFTHGADALSVGATAAEAGIPAPTTLADAGADAGPPEAPEAGAVISTLAPDAESAEAGDAAIADAAAVPLEDAEAGDAEAPQPLAPASSGPPPSGSSAFAAPGSAESGAQTSTESASPSGGSWVAGSAFGAALVVLLIARLGRRRMRARP